MKVSHTTSHIYICLRSFACVNPADPEIAKALQGHCWRPGLEGAAQGAACRQIYAAFCLRADGAS